VPSGSGDCGRMVAKPYLTGLRKGCRSSGFAGISNFQLDGNAVRPSSLSARAAAKPFNGSYRRSRAVEIKLTLWSDGVRRLMRRIRNMKLLGRWSLASFIKLVIDVPYYFLLVILPVVFAIAL
jgi:hypothetical protein